MIFESFVENLPEDFIPSQAANKTKAIEDKMFKYLSKDDYLRKAKAVATNISDKNNVDFINDILSGKISEDEIPKMDARSMASKNKKKEMEDILMDVNDLKIKLREKYKLSFDDVKLEDLEEISEIKYSKECIRVDNVERKEQKHKNFK